MSPSTILIFTASVDAVNQIFTDEFIGGGHESWSVKNPGDNSMLPKSHFK
jgi:hypothetical protein